MRSAITEMAKTISNIEPIVPELTEEEMSEAIETAYEAICGNELHDDCRDRIRQTAKAVTNKKRNFVFLSGGPGTGKSTMAMSVAIVISTIRRNKGLKVVKSTDINSENFEMLSKYQGALAIDDLGTETLLKRNYGNESFPLVELIYKRYDERLPLVFTTNLKASEVKERYGERIADRMNERAVLVKFTNNSYRR